ncbi:MAG TPA: hypothetical protein VKH81_08470 [Candidatus Angelobacter sp.]|nr:hypothetical protein [Candidatus Angelobacter sp.]
MSARKTPGVPMEDDGLGTKLQPGEVCAQSGLYEVTHLAHRAPHNVMVSANDVFPPCRQCGVNVRFRLLLGSSSEPEQPKARAAKKRGH